MTVTRNEAWMEPIARKCAEAGRRWEPGATAHCPPSAPMRQTSGTRKSSSERLVKNIRRVTRKQ